MASAALPTGTVTFLFTDIEGSTRLLQRLGQAGFQPLLETHHRLLRGCFLAHGGIIPRTAGDSFFVVFTSAPQAVMAAADAQRALANQAWAGAGIRVRIGLHTGEAVPGGDDYVGLDVHRAARICSAGHGGQVLLSEATRALAANALPSANLTLRDLGDHRLKDLDQAERLYQLDIPELPTEFPPLHSLSERLFNLPEPMTAFVGRETEIATAQRLLASTRLLTLTGPGGTGKTRLSIQIAHNLAGEFAQGARFVALAPITRPELVPSAVLQALGEPDAGARDPRERLLEAVREREALLLFDNFEQVLRAAPLVADILREAPAIKVLATSRSPLHLNGERELPVPPLGLPPHGNWHQHADDLWSSEAVRLFVDRARAVNPSFELTADNVLDVTEICARLDGLPLAIELAAARIRMLSPRVLLARLEHRLPLLSGGARDLPARQQTLRGAISWSYDLLDTPGQRLMARLAVFVGGADLDTVETVCGPAADLDGTEVLDGLEALVDQSLVRVAEADGDSRFWMLETIREFGREQLDASGESEAMQLRHARAFLALAERAAEELTGPRQAIWLDRLQRDADNLRAAIEASRSIGQPELALRLCWALWRFWQMRGQLVEARNWIDGVLADPATDGHPHWRMKGLEAAGGVAYWRGQMPEARGYYRESLALARTNGNPRDVANALYNLSFPYIMEGDDMATGRDLLQEAREVFTGLGDTNGLGNTVWALALVSAYLKDFEQANLLGEQALAAARASGVQFAVVWALFIVGAARVSLGQADRARTALEEALGLLTKSGDAAGLAVLLDAFAALADLEGDQPRAIRLVAASTALAQSSGAGLGILNRRNGRLWSFADRIAEWEQTADWAVGAAMSTDEAAAYAFSRGAWRTVQA